MLKKKLYQLNQLIDDQLIVNIPTLKLEKF